MEENLVKIVSTDSLIKLFDAQMQTLLKRGCLQKIIDVFMNKRNAVIAQAMKIDIPDGHIPFVPVIPTGRLDLNDLMFMIRTNRIAGYNYLDQSDVSNVVDVPKGLYFIYDVEDGKDMLGKSPEKAEALINKQKRTCLTTDEGIALCVHTGVLSEHYVSCTGSRCKFAVRVPGVCLSDNWPRLDWLSVVSSHDEWGSPSCKARI